MTAIRLPVSFSLAGLVTITLFWFLGALVSLDRGPGQLVRTVPKVDFYVNHVPDPDPIRIPPVKPPIVKPEPLPRVPGINVDPLPGVIPELDPSPFGVPDPFGLGGRGPLAPPGDRGLPPPGGTDRSALPQVRIEPDYPQIAKARGIEGWITFRFTVTREGRVTDVEIVDADPPRVWDQATLRAVSNWRYQPKLEDGVPVEQQGVTATYRFKLDR